MSTSFADMPSFRSSAPSSPPSNPRGLRKSYARRAERCCCTAVVYIPLLFVYGLTTWAVWVALHVALRGLRPGVSGYIQAGTALSLYLLANTSYTTSVFTGPGSPLEERKDLGRARGSSGRGEYQGLPTHDRDLAGPDSSDTPHGPMTMVTAKSTGSPRYCKKCQCVKPDRSHHCSTCGQCVLKMDHHCPWLATCVGLRNYKAFLLFLIYTSLFCWYCFILAGTWVWSEIANERQFEEGLQVVNTILLAVIGGIIGLVLTGFTGWHIYLTLTGQTTIESLEKTRYLSPLKKSMEQQLEANRTWLGQDDERGNQEQTLGEHLREIHANALPGILRPEEGEATLRTPNNRSPAPQHDSPAKAQLQHSYAAMEARREHDRYAAYLDERDSERLPNAFNLGWKRNLLHVFGAQPLFWFFPVCNTSGDGWQWEIAPAWVSARETIAREREARDRQERFSGPTHRPPPDYRWQPGQGFVRHGENGTVAPPPRMDSREMQPLDRRQQSHERDSSGSSSEEDRRRFANGGAGASGGATANWNDVPDDFLTSASRSKGGTRSTSQGRLGKGKGD